MPDHCQETGPPKSWKGISNFSPKNKWLWGIIALPMLALFFVLFDPTYYLHNTREIYVKSNMAQHIKAELKEKSYQKLDYDMVWPDRLSERGYIDQSRDGLQDYFKLAWKNSSIAGTINQEKNTCINVGIWAFGDQAYGKAAELGIGFCKQGSSPPDDESVIRKVSLEDKIVFKTATLSIPDDEDDLMLFVKVLNSHPVQKDTILYTIWPRVRLVKIFGVYYKETDCIETKSADL